MHPAMKGFLIGLAISIFLIVFEYMMVKKDVQERAQLRHKKPEFEPTDKKRVQAVVNFCLFVPPALAVGFWLVD